jgi:hypothetical protein
MRPPVAETIAIAMNYATGLCTPQRLIARHGLAHSVEPNKRT